MGCHPDCYIRHKARIEPHCVYGKCIFGELDSSVSAKYRDDITDMAVDYKKKFEELLERE